MLEVGKALKDTPADPTAARLVAWKCRPVEEANGDARKRQAARRGRTGRAGANNDDRLLAMTRRVKGVQRDKVLRFNKKP